MAAVLSLIPRGFQDVALDWLKTKLNSPILEFIDEKEIEWPNIDYGTVDSNNPINQSFGFDAHKRRIWCQPGHQFVWLKWMADNWMELSPTGTMLALMAEGEIAAPTDGSVPDAASSIRHALDTPLLKRQWEDALRLWKEYALTKWPISEAQRERITSNKLFFRLSCFRSHTKQYSYSRTDLIESVASWVVPFDWKVDLRKYDVEIVLIVRTDRVALGLTLVPYQLVGSKNFANGVLPPELPVIRGDFVRLRRSTAQYLLQVCELQPGDVLVDPCVGMGTILHEAPSHVVSMGGDVFLTPDKLAPPVVSFFQDHGDIVHLMSGWDAALLPIRDGCVDVVCSDLPFGQKCMSTNQLTRFLPTLVSECARILVPGSGRLTFLCGSFKLLLSAFDQVEDKCCGDSILRLWAIPPQAVFPVNVGGHLAWVVQVRRGLAPYKHHKPYRDRAHRMTAARNNLERRSKAGTQEKKRRIQS